MKYGLAVVVILLFPSLPKMLSAQQVSSIPSASAAKPATAAEYPAEAVVVERMDTVYRYNADGTGVKTDTDVVRVQSAAAVDTFSVLSIPYASQTQRIELAYLRVRRPDGSVVETPASDAQDQPAPVAEQAPFYSDLHLFQLPVRGLGVGDRVEYQVRTVQTRAEAPHEFWGQESFGHGVVVLERSLELRVPAKTYVQVSSPANAPQVAIEGAERVYRWHGAQLMPTPKTSADGTSANTTEDASAEGPPPVAWTTFRSWAEVGEWYRGLAEDRTVVTPALKAKADELVKGATTERAKMEALYAFVSSRVRYVGVSFGIGRYQPHTAAEVLANQYGDCKDKHTLLAALMKAEGIHASAVLIGAGVPFERSVPMPADFNHLITLAAIPAKGEAAKDVWLDATEEVAPFGMLDAGLRGKMALVIPATGTPELRRTPEEPPFAQVARFEADGTLNAKGQMTAQVDVHLRGDGELAMRELLRSVTPGQWDRVSELYANMLGFGGQTSDTVADAPERTNGPLHLHYTYTRAPYGDWSDYRIIPLIGGVNLPMTEAKTAPAEAIDLGGRRTDTSVSRITLPEGYSADLPPAVHVHTEFASFDKTYRLESEGAKDVLVTERTLTLHVDKLPASRWAEYKRFVDNTVGAGEPWVQLTSGATMNTALLRVSGHRPPAPGEDNQTAAELVLQAQQQFALRDWSGAQTKLEEARAVNPRQAYLWSEMGYVAQQTGNVSEAAQDYQRELAQHPEETNVSHLLAATERMQDQSEAAVATLKADLAYDARDEQGALMLADLLNSHAAYGEAEKALRTTLTAVPDSLPVRLTLGSTLVREGKTAEGAAILRQLATTSEDPGVLNDAAYALADAPQDVALAESAARRALEILDEATAADAKGQASPDEIRRASLLVTAWDTMGWVLYKEGKPAAAEPWLRAAWFHSNGRDTGYHLAMALAAQGKNNEALRTLELADGGEALTATDAENHDLCVEEEDTLRKAGAVATARDADEAPDGAQSFAMQAETAGAGAAGAAKVDSADTGAAKLEGSAMFQLRIGVDGVRTVDLTAGNPALQAMGGALKGLKLGQYVPRDSHGVVLRLGVMSCNEESGCEFVLTPMETATM